MLNRYNQGEKQLPTNEGTGRSIFSPAVTTQGELALLSAEVSAQTDKHLALMAELQQHRYTVTCNQANLGHSTYNYMQDYFQTAYPNGKSKNNLAYSLDCFPFPRFLGSWLSLLLLLNFPLLHFCITHKLASHTAAGSKTHQQHC